MGVRLLLETSGISQNGSLNEKWLGTAQAWCIPCQPVISTDKEDRVYIQESPFQALIFSYSTRALSRFRPHDGSPFPKGQLERDLVRQFWHRLSLQVPELLALRISCIRGFRLVCSLRKDIVNVSMISAPSYV